MGTLARITLYAPDPHAAKKGFDAAFRRIAQLDTVLSDYRADSELNRITRIGVGHPAHAGDDLFNVLDAAQRLAQETRGAFDVTQGPVIRLWREARRSGALPDKDALREAQARSGFHKLHLDPAKHTAAFDRAGMRLDVGAIAKGYAADEAIAVLTRMGIESALVAISGDLAFSHAPPGRRGWKIVLDAPVSRVLEMADGAVSTSGDEEQFLEIGGTRYSHIIDPASGQALTNRVTVSVLARRGALADPLATALCVLGPTLGLGLIEKHQDSAAIIVAANGVASESSRFSLYRQILSAGATDKAQPEKRDR